MTGLHRSLELPEGVLIITIMRKGRPLIPNGRIKLEEGDIFFVLLKTKPFSTN